MKDCLGHHLSVKPFGILLSFTHRPDLTTVARPGPQDLNCWHPDTSDDVLAAESAIAFLSLQASPDCKLIFRALNCVDFQVWPLVSPSRVMVGFSFSTFSLQGQSVLASGPGRQRNTPTLPCTGSFPPCGMVSQPAAY